MQVVVTPDQMAAADQAAVQAGTPSRELMERAGWAVARAALRLAGGAYGKRVVILCGKGNNAGDGFVAARHLAAAGAFPVVIFPVLPEVPEGRHPAGGPTPREVPEGASGCRCQSRRGRAGVDASSVTLQGDAAAAFDRLHGVRVVPWTEESLSRELRRGAVAVDALLGTGLEGGLREPYASVVQALNRSGIPVVAVDVPTGVDGEGGRVRTHAVRADVTVTMGALKSGLVLPPGCEFAGEVEVADIGIPEGALVPYFGLVDQADVAATLPARGVTSHKRSVGTVLVVAGSVGMSGAAALTASGALRAGAGLVTIAAPASVALELDQTVLEATTVALPETGRGTVESSAVDAVLQRALQTDVVAVGPGLSRDDETVQFVHKLVEQVAKPVVLDADGINCFAGRPEALASREAPTVLTPHQGELSRLIGSTTGEVSKDRIGNAREAARRTSSIVVLKGYRTVVAAPSGEVVIVGTGGPALATGGTGDVLTGVVAAFIAGGTPPFSAAFSAAWVHGRAGDLLAEVRGGRGVIAGDLLEAVPRVLRQLERME